MVSPMTRTDKDNAGDSFIDRLEIIGGLAGDDKVILPMAELLPSVYDGRPFIYGGQWSFEDTVCSPHTLAYPAFATKGKIRS